MTELSLSGLVSHFSSSVKRMSKTNTQVHSCTNKIRLQMLANWKLIAHMSESVLYWNLIACISECFYDRNSELIFSRAFYYKLCQSVTFSVFVPLFSGYC